MKVVKTEVQSKVFFSEEEEENKNIITEDWLNFEIFLNYTFTFYCPLN